MSWGDHGKARPSTELYRKGMDLIAKNKELEECKHQRDEFRKALEEIAVQSAEEGNNDDIFNIACKALEGVKNDY